MHASFTKLSYTNNFSFLYNFIRYSGTEMESVGMLLKPDRSHLWSDNN
jgi:hypothetical protein